MTEFEEKLLKALTETIREMNDKGVTPVSMLDKIAGVQPMPADSASLFSFLEKNRISFGVERPDSDGVTNV